MRRREQGAPQDPEVERDLETVDRVLAGEVTGGGASKDSWTDVATLLRTERPSVDADWAERLDEWAAAGFPRGERPRERRSSARRRTFGAPIGARFRELLERLPSGTGPLAGAAASLLIVAVVAVGTLGDDAGTSRDDSAGDGATATTSSATQSTAEPAAPGPGPQTTISEEAIVPEGGDGAQSQMKIEPARPDAGDAVGPRSFHAYDRGVGDERLAPGTANRRVDRDAQMTLAARPEEVRETSDEVIAIARSLGGIVAASQVSETGETAAASIDLRMPTRNLDSAIDRLAAIGDVDSLNESAVDITRPFVSAEDRLEDAEAERAKLLEALGNASTDEEAEAIRRQLRDARREISRAEARFENIARKARWSDLSVSVRSDSSLERERTLSDWLDDAGDVLRALAGVLLISAAIILPAGILIAIAWMVLSRLRRRRRERALDA